MTFILSSERAEDPRFGTSCFARYQEYLRANQNRFPRSAYELATADWYYSLSDPRGPHDGRLEGARIVEAQIDKPAGQRQVVLRVRLLNAYHDRHLEFTYSDVARYELHLSNGLSGHWDWRFDEFRLADDGRVIHEIEWWNSAETARCVIVAADVKLQSIPSPDGVNA